MKIVALITVFLITFNVIATEPTLKITSFRRLSNNDTKDKAAEVCGNLKGMEGQNVFVDLIVDYDYNPGHYGVLTDIDGRFCKVVGTDTGTIKARVRKANSVISITEARIK